jgi:hypothetical protein
MKRLIPIICMILAAGLLPLTAQQKSASIEFDNITVNAGKVTDGEVIVQVFRFINKGDATLEISNVAPSCGCTSAVPWGNRVAPGQTGHIDIKITTEGLAAQSRTVAETVSLSKTVTVSTNDPKQPQIVLTINGTVAPEIAFSDLSIYFGSNPRGREITKDLLVEIAPDRPVNLLGVESTDENVRVRLEPVPDSGGKKFKVIAVQKSTAGEGIHFGNIVLKTSSKLRPEIKITVRGIVTKGWMPQHPGL